MIKQHYGQELGLTHEEMESLQLTTESSMQTRWPSTQHTVRTGCQCEIDRAHVVTWCCLLVFQPDREERQQWGPQEAGAPILSPPFWVRARAFGLLDASKGRCVFPSGLPYLHQHGIKVESLLRCSLSVWTIFTNHFYLIWYLLQQNDYHNTSAQASLDRLGLDRASKHSSLSIDLHPKENSVTEESGSESIGDSKETWTLGYCWTHTLYV